jgi:hypothetical protein
MERTPFRFEPDPRDAWRRAREHYHRARAVRMLLPVFPPVFVSVLLIAGVIRLPDRLYQIVLWAAALAVYLLLWVLLIRDARKYVDAATEVDARFRVALGEDPAWPGEAEGPEGSTTARAGPGSG